MQRSEVNCLQREALRAFAEHRFALPPFATWNEAEWRNNPEAACYCHAHQMGWDITDFGSGDFAPRARDLPRPERRQGFSTEKPYAKPPVVPRSTRRRIISTASRWRTSSAAAAQPDPELAKYVDGALAEQPVTVTVDDGSASPAPASRSSASPARASPSPARSGTAFTPKRATGRVRRGGLAGERRPYPQLFLRKGRPVRGIEEDQEKLYPLWNELKAVSWVRGPASFEASSSGGERSEAEDPASCPRRNGGRPSRGSGVRDECPPISLSDW